MRNLALTSLLALLASCSFTWQGQSSNLSPEAREAGLQDPATLARAYASHNYWRDVRRNMDGITNALDRDMKSIGRTIDRHFMNYSPDDPYVNHATDENYWTTIWSRAASFASTYSLPFMPAR